MTLNLLLPRDVLTWTLGGVGFGLVTTFHREAFRWPLILLTVATFTAFVLAAWWPKRKAQSQGLRRMKSRSFRVLIVLIGIIACGYFVFTTRYRIEAKIWHVRHGYSTRVGNWDVPAPEHWFVYLQDSLVTVLVNTAPIWHRDGRFHTVASITVSMAPIGPNASNGMNFWLQWKRQGLEQDGVKSVEEKKVVFDNDTAVCIGGSEMRDVTLRGTTIPTAIVSLECKSESGLNISLLGEPSDLQTFYTWLSEIRRHR